MARTPEKPLNIHANPQTGLTLNMFQILAGRTVNARGANHFFRPPVTHPDGTSNADEMAIFQHNKALDLIHAVLGCVTEVGELADPVKKAMQYGKPLDETNIREEAGDLLWYIAGPLCRALGCTLEDLARENVEKLQRRYPDRYTDSAAVLRADKSPDMFAPNWRRRILSAEQLAEVLAKYKHSTFEDGFYYDDDDKCWVRIDELWEQVTS